jgi:hypothetical protein
MIKKKPNKIIESNNLGLYLRPNNYDDYIDNYQTVHRNIQINSGDRNIKIYPDPFKFVTHVGNSMISFDNTGKQINTHPCIRNKLPALKKIYLRKIIIPNNYLIIKKKISDCNDIKNIKDKIEELILSQININQTYLIDKHFFTVVNYIQNEKLNVIVDYKPEKVISFVLDNDYIIDTYSYTLNYNNPSKQQRVFYLNISEFNDNCNYYTDNSKNIATFKLLPKSLKGRFLYASANGIQKIFDTDYVKTNKLSISLLDQNNQEVKIGNLDYDIITNGKCVCCFENINYSCSCNYILHPLNPIYQIFMFFNFTYDEMIMPYNEL